MENAIIEGFLDVVTEQGLDSAYVAVVKEIPKNERGETHQVFPVLNGMELKLDFKRAGGESVNWQGWGVAQDNADVTPTVPPRGMDAKSWEAAIAQKAHATLTIPAAMRETFKL